MSTNQTTNYQLHLWEPEDDFQRTEFNDNSNAIDGALGGLATQMAARPMVFLKSFTTTAAARELDFDFSDMDFTRFLWMELHSFGLRSSNGSTSVQGYVNGIRTPGSYYYSSLAHLSLGSLYDSYGMGYKLRLLFGDAFITFVTESIGNSSGNGFYVGQTCDCTAAGAGLTAATLDTLTLSSSAGNFQPGARFYLYGMLK